MRRTRTALSALVAVTTMSLFVPAASAVPTPSSAAASGATALLTGRLVLLTDAHRGEGPGEPPGSDDHEHAEDVQAYLDVEGTPVPVSAASLESVGSQSVVTVEVPVPADVADAVSQGEPVAVTTPLDGGDEAVIPVSELTAAQEEPAPAGSDLAAATAVAASGGEAPVAASLVEAAPASAPAVSQQPHEVTVAVVGVNGKTDPRYTDAEVARLVGETSDYWSDQTAGAVTFRVSGPVTRYTSAISCTEAWRLWDEARVETGFRDGPNRHLVLMVPRSAYDAKHCYYGYGSIGSGVSTGGASYVADASWPVLAHELGHNMSLQHANRLRCGPASTDVAQTPTGAFAGTACSQEEYGDRADVMSASSLDAAGSLGVVGLRQLGLLGADDQQAVTEAGVTSVELAPLGAGEGQRVASVTDPRNGNAYYLENRQGAGRDWYGFGYTGVYDQRYNPQGSPVGLRVLKRSASGSSVLLDPTPTPCTSTCPRDVDTVIAPGSTFRSVADGVEIRSRQNADGSVVADVSVAGAGEQHWGGVVSTGEATVVTAGAVKARSTAATILPVTVTTASTRALVPGGTVTVTAGGVRLGSAIVSRGKASVKLPALPRGRQDLTVAYEPPAPGSGAALAGSSSIVTLDVAGAAARVSATLTPRTVTIADAPSVAVSVSASGAVPTGAVTVADGATTLGSGTLVKGKATIALPLRVLGKHSLVATYEGDEKVEGGRAAPAVLTVTPLPVSVVTVSASRATTAQQVTVTATVRAAGRAGTGEVSVVRDGQTVVSGQLANGRATLTLPPLAAGRHEVSVVHADSPAVTGGTRAVTLTVAPAKPVVTAVPASATVTQGSSTSIAVAVGAPGVAAAGTVRLMRSRLVLEEVALVDGRAVLTVPADLPADLPVGRQSLTVAYAGSSELTAGTVTVPVTVVR